MKFRKKPVVVVEARLYDPRGTIEEVIDLESWCGGTETTKGLFIPTLEGVTIASPGDWVIQGVAGEFYACKPDIFEKTYERAE